MSLPATRLPAVAGLFYPADPEGRDLMKWRTLADNGSVTSVDMDDSTLVSIGGEVERSRSGRTIPAENVGAVLPGGRGVESLAQSLISHGADNVYVVEDDRLGAPAAHQMAHRRQQKVPLHGAEVLVEGVPTRP